MDTVSRIQLAPHPENKPKTRSFEYEIIEARFLREEGKSYPAKGFNKISNPKWHTVMAWDRMGI